MFPELSMKKHNKRLRKLARRTHTAAAIAVQDRWIAETLGLEAGSRRERDSLFTQARAAKDGQ